MKSFLKGHSPHFGANVYWHNRRVDNNIWTNGRDTRFYGPNFFNIRRPINFRKLKGVTRF